MNPLRVTLVGGPTALIELDGFRILTDGLIEAKVEEQYDNGPVDGSHQGKPPIIFDGITGNVGFTGFDRPC